MSERVWSDAQKEAIEVRDHAVLVSAGAGSGKTSVLVERILERVLGDEAVDVDRILIVTFTEAAAAEMKERIARAIREAASTRAMDERLARQLYLLDRATISTLHSFCMQVIRTAALELPVDPGFRVMDGDEQAMLQQLVLDEMLEEKFSMAHESFLGFVERYGGQYGEERLRAGILKLYEFARSQPDSSGWVRSGLERFEKDAEGPLAKASFAESLFQSIEEAMRYALTLNGQAATLCLTSNGPAKYLPVLKRDEEMLRKALEAATDRRFDLLCSVLSESLAKLPTDRDAAPEAREQVQDLRKKMKEVVSDLAEGLCSRSEEQLLDELRETAQYMQALVDLEVDFADRYARTKRQRAVVDFSDLEHLAYGVLADAAGRPTSHARMLADRFIEVMVDEYQDTSPIQDAILSMVLREGARNMFQVGDVKQSIYRFRMAEPNLFLDKYRKYSEGALGRKIDLADNYRSRSGIMDVINYLFGQIFSPNLGGISYDEHARMRAAASYPAAAVGIQTLEDPVEIHLVEKKTEGKETETGVESSNDEGPDQEDSANLDDAKEDLTSIEWEASLIANRLLELRASGASVYDGREKVYRPLRWRDVVVLLRSKAGRMEPFLRVFRQLGVPACGESDSGYYSGLEMRLAVSLLEILDNPSQDIPLAAVMRSPVGGFSTTELAKVRADGSGDLYEAVSDFARRNPLDRELFMKITGFMKRLDSWRTFVRSHSAGEGVAHVIAHSGLLEFCRGLPEGSVRVANLERLVRQGETYDDLEKGGFAGFVAFLFAHRLREGDVGGARALGEQEDVVRVMTIHKSKGLEFPVVVLADMGKRFRLNDAGDMIGLHRTLGFGPDFVDLEQKQRFPTAASIAISAAEERACLAEEARVLYVALTRAKEKLILVGSVAGIDKKLEKWQSVAQGPESESQDAAIPLPESVLVRSRTFLDWIMPAVYRFTPQGSPLFHIHVWNMPGGDAIPTRRGALMGETDWKAVANLTPGALFPMDGDRETRLLWQQRFLQWTTEVQEAVRVDPIPAKLSVTEWKRHWQMRLGDLAEEPDVAVQVPPRNKRPLRSWDRPRFLQADRPLTAAEKGTAFHKALQYIPLSHELTNVGYVEAELDRLLNQGHLRPEERRVLVVEEIAAFFSSNLGRRMIANPGRVSREVSFTVALPANLLMRAVDASAACGLEDASVIVQGTADCLVFEENGILLLDYKTDRNINDLSSVAKRYETQLALYRYAVERAFDVPVTETYLYFVFAQKAVAVESSSAAIWSIID